MRARETVKALEERVEQLEGQIDALVETLWTERYEPTRWVTERCVEEFGLEVQAGPFAGLRYVPELVGRVDALAPKLIGAYERELHQAIRAMVALAAETLVTVGAADGYYAVGFALASPATQVRAYELDAERREGCTLLAEANGVSDRVTVEARCTPELLAELAPGACILIDCAGCESELLTEAALPGLRRATLLVELHDGVDKAATGMILRRFSSTHEVELIDGEPRNVDDFPEPSFLNPRNRQIAIWEFRSRPMRWAILRPRSET
jgi:hypothetical protein